LTKAEFPQATSGSVPAPALAGEAERGEVLRRSGFDSLDDDPELCAIVAFAADLCGTEVSLVTLVGEDSQRFLARRGTEARETPRSISFCAHAMVHDGLMQVPDAREDRRFAANPLVAGEPFIRFYAGQPLVSPEGVPLGALCVVDFEPRPGGLTELQRRGLEVLGASAMLRMRAHRKRLEIQREAEAREEQLRTLADSIPAIAWSADADGNFDYFNRQLRAFTGDDSHRDGSAIHRDDFDRVNKLWEKCRKTGEIYETEHRILRHDGEYRWMMARAVPVKDADGRVVRWFGTAVDIHDAHLLSESRDLLARELSHRIKNIFAVIAGLVSLSARKRPEFKAFADELTGTIRALGRAHDFVRPIDSAARDNLHGLLGELFAPYGVGDGARVKVSGDDLSIASRAATPLALVFHELATNSAKYGALATDDGTVTLDIADNGDDLVLAWRENGGKVPKRVPKEGFGSRLVEMSVTGQLGGTWERRFEPDGLAVDLTISKAAVAA